ncbi:hypothetical protein [Bifidobacterium mongoliense]|uniref:hypothetical protein n=1 Tax=Bifidobacterium mongoliense TaxID=518643 RepID=UPI0030EF4E27
MAGATHPFFGNQYTDGSYITGSFKFPKGLTRRTINHISKIAAPDSLAMRAINNSAARETSPLGIAAGAGVKGKWVIPTFIVAAITAAVSGYFIYQHIKKKGKVEVPNVGVCEHCGEPLTGAKLVADNEMPYIICNKCGEKNFAKYHDNESTKE